MDSFNLKRFGLEDEEQMRSVIEANDIVVGEEQDISRLYTPRGNQRTAYKHWTAHDRDLIQVTDLEKMLRILNEIAPEIGADAVEYLHKGTFLGFNCFVMRRELFQQMCSVEFEVLQRLESEVDLSDYNQQLSRIYGFMAEIIFSAYIYHIEKSGKYRVKRVPLVYFNYTDALPVYQTLNKPNMIPVLFLNDLGISVARFSPAIMWQSFLEHMEDSVYYDVYFCLPGMTATERNQYQKMAAAKSNVRVTFIPYELYYAMMEDQIGERTPILPFLPWIFQNYDAMMFFGDHLLFADSICEMWKEARASSKLVAAPCDIVKCAQITDIYSETAEKYISKQVQRPLNWFNAGTCVLNLKEFRETLTLQQVYSKCLNNLGDMRNPYEYLNVVCEGSVAILDQRWNTWFESNEYLKYALPRAPLNKYKALQVARKKPGIVSYMPNDTLEAETNELTYLYWDTARHTPFYEQNLATMIEFRIARTQKPSRDVLNKWFPRSGRMRGILSLLFPKGSKRNSFVRKILSIFHVH